MTITRNFKLCLNAGTQNAPYINVNQYDEGEEWVFDLYTEGGQKFTPSTGAIIGIKSDGNAILNSGTVNSDGQVVITETQQMTAASGLAVFELLIEGETHGTANFIVNVERRPSDDAEFSDSDLSMLQEAIDAAEVINEILDEGGDPSEIITENVNNWLDNHPEATTTVEDGAITAPKINNSLWDKILVNEEVSGNPASFEDGADDVPVSSLKVALEPIQTGSGDPSPTNIRPITGHSTVTVDVVGKNLLQLTTTSRTVNGVEFTFNDDGSITCVGTATNNIYATIGYVPLKSGVEYTITGCPSGGTSTTYYLYALTAGGNKINYGGATTFTASADENAEVRIRVYNGYTINQTFYPMFRYASVTDTTYEPHQSASYPYSLGQTVYGGSIDLATGVLTIDKAFIEVTETSGFSLYDHGVPQAGGYYFGIRKTFNAAEKYSVNPHGYFSHGDYSNTAVNGHWRTYVDSSHRIVIVCLSDTDITSTAEANAFLQAQREAGTPLQIVYPLIPPTTVQLTPQEVKTLLGYNNISSTGTVDVIYHADTKLYIDKRIAELG